MKRIIAIAAFFLMAIPSFAQLVITQKKDEPIEKQRSTSVSCLDFRKWNQEGFFLSTGDCHMNYTPICAMEITTEPETIKNTGKRKISDPVYHVTEISNQDLISEAVDFAKKMGANGIVNLSIKVIGYGPGGDIMVAPNVNKYIVTGLCISVDRNE